MKRILLTVKISCITSHIMTSSTFMTTLSIYYKNRNNIKMNETEWPLGDFIISSVDNIDNRLDMIDFKIC